MPAVLSSLGAALLPVALLGACAPGSDQAAPTRLSENTRSAARAGDMPPPVRATTNHREYYDARSRKYYYYEPATGYYYWENGDRRS